MKTLWCVGLVLLLAVPVVAGTTSMWGGVTGAVIIEDNGLEVTSITRSGGERIFTTCEKKLEAAMRAMEPFLDHWTYNEDGSITTNLDAPVQVPIITTDTNDPRMKKLMKERNKAHTKALEQWDAAKQCWRTP